MKDNIKKHLVSMGYRLVNNFYIKPVGYNLLIFDVNTLTIKNVFIGADNETHVFNSEIYNETENNENFLNFIKRFEVYTSYYDLPSNFEFLTVIDKINFLL